MNKRSSYSHGSASIDMSKMNVGKPVLPSGGGKPRVSKSAVMPTPRPARPTPRPAGNKRRRPVRPAPRPSRPRRMTARVGRAMGGAMKVAKPN